METLTFKANSSASEILKIIMNKESVKSSCIFDLSKVEDSSSALIAMIDEFRKKDNLQFKLSPKLQTELLEFQQLINYQVKTEQKIGFLEEVNNKINSFFKQIFNFIILSADCFFYAIKGLFSAKGRRKNSIFEQTYLMGYKAVPIITLLSILIGLILSIQSAQQLKQFGANIFLVDLIVISMISEMGPMITAIIVAGRSGSAIAAEIATMKITEEIDALEVMALNPLKYIVTPKFIAMNISLPVLTIIANLVGITGGFIIAVLYLDLNPDIFIARAIDKMSLYIWFQSLVKSILFSWVIVLISVFYGLNVTGGSEGVGKGTTSSVVASIFSVIVLDAILSLIFYFKF